jgi:hypothetical protein
MDVNGSIELEPELEPILSLARVLKEKGKDLVLTLWGRVNTPRTKPLFYLFV